MVIYIIKAKPVKWSYAFLAAVTQNINSVFNAQQSINIRLETAIQYKSLEIKV